VTVDESECGNRHSHVTLTRRGWYQHPLAWDLGEPRTGLDSAYRHLRRRWDSNLGYPVVWHAG